jgi:3-deoxy-manno-octulosonate cytidylyltransferase (CMP-KDO synthetase)
MIDGRPMIEHVLRRAERARTLDAVLVATDDTRIADAVSASGGFAVMTSASHLTGTDRLAEVASSLNSEVVVNIQGDEPLMPPQAIDAAVQPLLDEPGELISTLRRNIDEPGDLRNPSVVKVVVDLEGYALYFTRSAVPYTRSGESPVAWRHLGLYAYRRTFLLKIAKLAQTPLERAERLEQLRVLEHGYRIRTVETNADAIGVDTPEDLERVRRLIETSFEAYHAEH